MRKWTSIISRDSRIIKNETNKIRRVSGSYTFKGKIVKIKVLIMSGYGINCEKESAHAFNLVGAESEIVHINDLIDGTKSMEKYHIMMFPGGFSYGDDTGSGNAFSNKVRNNLWPELKKFIADGKLILGVCNGFQVMSNLGLFSVPITEYGTRINAMEANDSNRYECRWIHIKNNSEKCVFTKGLKTTHLPIAHGEGRFFCEEKILKELADNDQIVFTYCDEEGDDTNPDYPINPNGSLKNIAGICDKTGRLMGMMPHPERAIYSTSEPEFQLKRELAARKKTEVPGFIESNLTIFRNSVDYCKVYLFR